MNAVTFIVHSQSIVHLIYIYTRNVLRRAVECVCVSVCFTDTYPLNPMCRLNSHINLLTLKDTYMFVNKDTKLGVSSPKLSFISTYMWT